LPLPEISITGNPFSSLFEGFWNQPESMDPSVPLTGEEASALKDLEML
jgi:hypothetical protein